MRTRLGVALMLAVMVIGCSSSTGGGTAGVGEKVAYALAPDERFDGVRVWSPSRDGL